jgi:ATP-binding cassette, subfamily C, bacterial PrsD
MASMAQSRNGHKNSVREAVRKVSPWFTVVALFSAAVNILMLTGSLYMLQIYDRVLASGSVPTLVMLSLFALAAYAAQGVLDAMRMRMLSRVGAEVERDLTPKVFDAVTAVAARGTSSAQALGPERDLESIRGFLSGLGPTALLDMPFMPIFFFGCFLLHPWLGWLAISGGVIVIAGAVLVEWMSSSRSKVARDVSMQKMVFMEACRRNAEAIVSMGLRAPLRQRWSALNDEHSKHHIGLGDVTSSVGSFVKVLRMILQSAVIGLGGYLAIHQEISAGAIIAASVMLTRGLAPLEIAIANWKGFIAFRQGFSRLGQLLDAVPDDVALTELPVPRESLTVENIAVTPPGALKPVLKEISFSLPAGSAVCIMGPSGSGKSTLARALVGIWPAAEGTVRLDGASIGNWKDSALGEHVGYLPQDIELFEGSIADNIGRFAGPEKSKDIIQAARAAGAHNMILALPDGYETRIGEGGTKLSGGQRQRIALARALFGAPFLLVLDEPNSNLDAEGEAALNSAIMSVRNRGGVAVVITHRLGAATACNYLAVIVAGELIDFDRRETMLQSPSPSPSPSPSQTGQDGARVLAGPGTQERPALAVQGAQGHA